MKKLLVFCIAQGIDDNIINRFFEYTKKSTGFSGLENKKLFGKCFHTYSFLDAQFDGYVAPLEILGIESKTGITEETLAKLFATFPELDPTYIIMGRKQFNKESNLTNEPQELYQTKHTQNKLLEEKDKKLLLKELDGNLLSALNGKKVLNSGIALKAFKLENEGNLQQEDGIWYVKNGESVVSLDTAVANFLETDFGKTLVPPTSKARGSGLKPQNTTVVPKEDSKKNSLDDLFLED